MARFSSVFVACALLVVAQAERSFEAGDWGNDVEFEIVFDGPGEISIPAEEMFAEFIDAEKKTESLFEAFVEELIDGAEQPLLSGGVVVPQDATRSPKVEEGVIGGNEFFVDALRPKAKAEEVPEVIEMSFDLGQPMDMVELGPIFDQMMPGITLIEEVPTVEMFQFDTAPIVIDLQGGDQFPPQLAAQQVDDLMRDVLGRRFGPFGPTQMQPRTLDSFFSSSEFLPASFTTFPMEIFPSSLKGMVMDLAPMPFQDADGNIVDSMDHIDCDGNAEQDMYMDMPMIIEIGQLPYPDEQIEIMYEVDPAQVGLMNGELLSMSSMPLQVELQSQPQFLELPEGIEIIFEELPAFEIVDGGFFSAADTVSKDAPMEPASMVNVAAWEAPAKPAMKSAFMYNIEEVIEEPTSMEEILNAPSRADLVCFTVGVTAIILTLINICCCASPDSDEDAEELLMVNVVDVDAYTPLMSAEVPEETTKDVYFISQKMEPMDFENPIKA